MTVTGLSQYRASFQQAQASVKTLDAELKRNEAQYKATGDKEKYLEERMKLLQKQLEAQKKAAAEAEKALKTMKEQGVDQNSRAYQDFQTKLANAQAAMYNTTAAINTLGSGAETASTKTQKLSDSISNISKTVSLDAVIKGIDSITSAMESAGQKAIELGENIWSSITDTAAMADDIATLAEQLGLTITEVQQMMYVSHEFEAPVEAMGKAWRKVSLSMKSDSEDVKKAYEAIGVSREKVIGQGKYGPITELKDYKDVFWEIGEAIAAMDESADKEDLANRLLGRSWREFQTLFSKGRTAYEEAMAGVETATEDATLNAAEFNDAIQQLEDSFTFFKIQVLGDIAPELKTIVTTVENLLTSITEYLKTDEGQELLHSMADAIGALFDELTNIDPEQAAQTLANVFTSVKDALLWIKNNSQGVVTALEIIIGGWGTLKLAGGALKVLELVNGIKMLKGMKNVNLPNLNGDGGTGGTGQENVTSQNVTTQNVTTGNATTQNVTNETVTNATLTNVTATIQAANTTTSRVVTMFVETLITGSGLPGTGNGGGDAGLPGVSPTGLPSGSDLVNGYLPPIIPTGLPTGSDIYLGNPAQDYLMSGGGGSDINITGSNPTINLPAADEIPVLNPNGANNPNAINLNPDEYEVMEAATLLEIMMMKIGGAAYSFATMDPTGVTALMGQWILDNTRFGQTLQQGGTLVEALSESGNFVRNDLNKIIAQNYQDMVDAQYKAVFGKDTKELAADASKALTDLWGSVKEGVLDPISTKATEIANAFNEALEKPATKTVDLKPRTGGWPYSYGGGMGATYSMGLGDILLDMMGYSHGHANGSPYISFTGYRLLHRGERVLTAEENKHYTYNNNNYFGTVNLNNGQDIEALTDALERRNRRQRAGYGS